MTTSHDRHGHGGRPRASPPARPAGRRAMPKPAAAAAPWAQPRMPYRPTEVLSADELESIHLASLQVLAEIGMDFLDPRRADLLWRPARPSIPARSASTSILPSSPEAIRTAPSTFTLHARNPEHDLRIGGDWMAFGSVGSRAERADLDRGRGSATGPTTRTCSAWARCSTRSTSSRAIRSSRSTSTRRPPPRTPPTMPLTLADKPIHCLFSLGRQRNIDALEMVAHRPRHR